MFAARRAKGNLAHLDTPSANDAGCILEFKSFIGQQYNEVYLFLEDARCKNPHQKSSRDDINEGMIHKHLLDKAEANELGQ